MIQIESKVLYGGSRMKVLSKYLQKSEDTLSIIEGIKSGLQEQLVAGLSNSARSLFVASLLDAVPKKSIIITHQLVHAQQLYEDLSEFSHTENVFLYPVNELIASEMAISSPELRTNRIKALTDWLKQDEGILVAPIAALKRVLPPREYWTRYALDFKEAEQINLDEYMTQLVEMGYERVDMVTTPGEFSIRGGIIDIYSAVKKYPVRIELFDDEVDSIRDFDADTQRSLERTDAVTIGPATELLVTQTDMMRAKERLEQLLASALKKMKASDKKETLMSNVEHDIDKLAQGETFQEMYKYSSLFYEKPHSLLDYIDDDGLLIFDEIGRIQESAQYLDKEEAEFASVLMEQQQFVPDVSFSFDWTSLIEKMNVQRIYLSVFMRHIPNTQPANIVNMSTRTMQEFHGQMPLFKSELDRWKKLDYSVLILTVNH